MPSKPLFSPQEGAQIKDAVEKAEGRTSGEIVPVIVASSSEYGETDWKALFFGSLIGLVSYEVYAFYTPGWDVGNEFTLAVLPTFLLVGALLFFMAAKKWPFFRRLLIANQSLDESVHTGAKQAFLDNEVFLTKDRTGVVLYVSLFEHRVEVLGDKGINAKVTAEDWTEIVGVVVHGIREGKLVDGLIAGIEGCGELLEKLGLERQSDDTNELSNEAQF